MEKNTFQNKILYRNKSTRLKLINNTDKIINSNINRNLNFYIPKKLSFNNNYPKLNKINNNLQYPNSINNQTKTIDDYIKENLELKLINNKLSDELKKFKIENKKLLDELNNIKNKHNSNFNNLFYIPTPNSLKTKIKLNTQLNNIEKIKSKIKNYSMNKTKKNILLNLSNSNLITTIDNSPHKYSIENTFNSNKQQKFLQRKNSTKSARNIKKKSIKLINTNLTIDNKKICFEDKNIEKKLNNIKYKINVIFNALYKNCINNINKINKI